MKILYTTTVGLSMIFFKEFIKELIDNGNTVDIATNENEHKVDDYYRELGCKVYQINWTRSPISKSSVTAAKELKQLLLKNDYDVVHCHTPIAGVCTRLACKGFRKKGLRVFYTAHGFHFYKGCPKMNRLVFYPIELICSHFTDILITINSEDYALAEKKMKAKHIKYVPGVGVDLNRFKNTTTDRIAKREELKIPKDAFLILSVGEHNENKNHELVIRAMAKLNNPDICYMIAGQGELTNHLISLAKEFKLEDRLFILGFRKDIAELHKASDLYVLPSKREGLNVSLIEACASELPCLASRIRGNVDIVNHNENELFDYNSVDELCEKINDFINCSPSDAKKKYRNDVSKFSPDIVNAEMMKIYYEK